MQSSSEFLFLIISGKKKGLNVLLVHANEHPVMCFGLGLVFTPPVQQQEKSTQKRYLKSISVEICSLLY